MATLTHPANRRVDSAGARQTAGLVLGTAQTGNVSTDVFDRGDLIGSVLLEIVSTVGATPSVVPTIVGSMDGTNFFNIAYATVAAPETVSVAAMAAITTATTTRAILRPYHPWRYMRVDYSANTNVTLTTTIYPLF